jgi:hypothetical protein
VVTNYINIHTIQCEDNLGKGLFRTILCSLKKFSTNTTYSCNLTSGKYFNKGVKALDAPDLGHVVRETPDKIVVFGDKDERYDIPISEINQVGANVLIGLPFSEIEKKYEVSRKEPLPTSRQDPWREDDGMVDLSAYEGKYPNSLFNKGVRANNEDDVGYVIKETKDSRIWLFKSKV